MDRNAFIKHVRNWESKVVAEALASDPKLALFVDQNGKSALHHCAGINGVKAGLKTRESVATAKALVSAGADVNLVRVIMDEGEQFLATPLWYAVAWGKNIELVKFLLDNKATPDDNAMRSAIWEQDEAIAELIASHGGRVDAAIANETPLLQTLRSKRFKLLDWLIAKGAKINFQDAAGYTALHYAIKGNHTLTQIEQLLRQGAGPQIKAKDGTTPLSLARKSGKSKLVALLEKFV